MTAAPAAHVLDRFNAATAAWFREAFDGPTAVQEQGWAEIADGRHTLLISPTGSGKTLAAFLWAISRVTELPEDAEPGVRVLYLSPLKALAYDVERNLRAPLIGIGRAAARLGQPFRAPRIGVRTGDTTSSERRRQLKDPGEIFVTTPESLYLILGGKAAARLRTVHTVIVDEIHVMAGTKRGAHLALSLERLAQVADVRPQRIGLSATVRPVEDVAHWLGGSRNVGSKDGVAIVDTSAKPALDLEIVVPMEDMARRAPVPEFSAGEVVGGGESGPVLMDFARDGMGAGAFQDPGRAGVWSQIHPKLLELIRAHRTSILFVNSRGLCERMARRLNELAEEDLVRAHHGSVSHAKRAEIEEGLKEGRLRGIVATSSLELGIDMGTVDLVVLVESPGATARGLQRVGRAGHGVGETSIGRLFPKWRGDLLEAAVVARRMQEGRLEPISVPRNALDVLAQQIVAMCAVRPWTVDELESTARAAFPYADLSRDALVSVLDMLSGRYPSTDFADLRPRLNWDRERDVLAPRPGAKMIAAVNAGTIPDRGLYAVQIAPDGPRVGELDEEMVHESRVGETFVLGASTWRVEGIERDRVLVSPAPGQPGKMPFWHGEGPGRPIELGRAVGEFLREFSEQPDDRTVDWLQGRSPLDVRAARNLDAYLREQLEATGALPTDRTIVVERFRDELGDWRVCLHTPFGARVHAPWALAMESALSGAAGFDIQATWTDDGIVLRFADIEGTGAGLPSEDALIPDPDDVEDRVVEQLAQSALFASMFRENAARSLLLTRAKPGQRMPLWAQRVKSSNLLAAAKQYPAFPVILETYRSCLADHFDLDALREVLSGIRRRDIKLELVETDTPSPFARSLVIRLVASHMYEGDAPLAERRAQALNLDRNLLRELLGHDELRELLDLEIIEQVERELQCLTADRRVRNADALHDLLRRLGDLGDEEAGLRSEVHPGEWLLDLQDQRRVACVRVAGAPRWVAVEDVARYRDALGAMPPPGLPSVFLEPSADPVIELLRRYSRTHGPFTTVEIAARFGMMPAAVSPLLAGLQAKGDLLRGGFRPGRVGDEWCAQDVLRRIRRRTLAKLRGEVAPVDSAVLGRFLVGWQGVVADKPGVHVPKRGRIALEDALDQLEGLPLSFKELEGRILPSRVPDFRPEMLDELGATGDLLWVGRGALGTTDGRVSLHRPDRPALLPSPEELPDSPLHEALLTHLRTRGASFLTALLAVDPGLPASEVLSALWDLVWAGGVTNDTFGPLRNLGRVRRAAKRSASAAGRGRRPPAGRRGLRARSLPGAGGRWYLTDFLTPSSANDTERAHALAVTLLERYGVVSREAAKAESIPGGFTSIYRVLQAMEEGGRARRGWFVDGLGGAQFALPGAVDRLRAARRLGDEPEVRVLAATDPANVYGSLLSWPTGRNETVATAKRLPGATVVLVDGRLILHLGAARTKLTTFASDDDERDLPAALHALYWVGRRARVREIRIERIDGEPALASPLRPALARAGFTEEIRGLTLDTSRPRRA